MSSTTGADPGFLDRGSYLQRGFDLLILPDYLLFFPDFLKKNLSIDIILVRSNMIITSIPHKNENLSEPLKSPLALDPPTALLSKFFLLT